MHSFAVGLNPGLNCSKF